MPGHRMTPDLAALVSEYRAARDVRRAAGDRHRAANTDQALDALNRAIRLEQDAAVRVAYVLAERAERGAQVGCHPKEYV